MKRLRAQLTLAAAIVFFFGGTAYGVKLVTKPANTVINQAKCESRTVTAGHQVTTNLVRVNVYNSSQRAGLANRVTIDLQRNGFLGGVIGNSESGIVAKNVVIVTDDRTDPQVQLVSKQFKDKVAYADPKKPLRSGVTVVVGDDYSGLAKKPVRSVKSDRTIHFCLPVVTVD